MNTTNYSRDTLIGSDREITHGNTGGYVWSVTADTVLPGRLLIQIRRAGGSSPIPIDKAPNYVLAAILGSVSSNY